MSIQVEVKDKVTLSIEEASAYSGIGVNKIKKFSRITRLEKYPKVHFVILHCMWVRRLLSKDKSSRIS